MSRLRILLPWLIVAAVLAYQQYRLFAIDAYLTAVVGTRTVVAPDGRTQVAPLSRADGLAYMLDVIIHGGAAKSQ